MQQSIFPPRRVNIMVNVQCELTLLNVSEYSEMYRRKDSLVLLIVCTYSEPHARDDRAIQYQCIRSFISENMMQNIEKQKSYKAVKISSATLHNCKKKKKMICGGI